MRININNQYFIECADGMNVNLCENAVNKKEEPTVKVLGYYGTIQMACKAALELQINKSDTQNLEELSKLITRSKAEIIAAVKNAESLKSKF